MKDKQGNTWEFDVIAKAGKLAIIVDVESSYNRMSYIEHFTQVVLPRVPQILSDLLGYKIVGCIASFSLEDTIVQKASELGVLAISIGGNNLELCNQELVGKII